MEDEKKEQFDADIERAMPDCDLKYNITAGDFNAKIETEVKERTPSPPSLQKKPKKTHPKTKTTNQTKNTKPTNQ